jgi:CubicO group peptidase (beta-lactamase class C family)
LKQYKKQNMKKLLLLFTLFSFINVTYSLDSEKLDELMNNLDVNDRAMGSLSIAKDGVESYSKAIGYENVSSKIEATTKTKYRIGSISKTFTAVVIMNLIEEGKLGLDTKLSDYYSEVENADNITIKQMLKHRSGIYSFTNDPSYFDWMEHPISKEELLDKINEYDSSFEPGSKAEYSNSNYIMLTLIPEDASGKTISQL